MNIPVSVMIITLNEEQNLPHCFDSLQWCNDIVVLDSGSSDTTTEIAFNAGARVIEHPFINYESQRNFALREIEYKNPWVLMVDADEVVPPAFAEEIKSTLVETQDDICLYRLRRKDFFLGKWIKHSSGYPTWFGRLMRVGKVRVERCINEEYVTHGNVGYLKEHFHHFPFRKGLSSWLEKHNRYSSMEAELIIGEGLAPLTLKGLFQRDPSERRKFQKSILYRLPGRPFLVFVLLYFVRGGFLDGRPGLTFCLLRSWYEFMINCKVRELRRREKGLPI